LMGVVRLDDWEQPRPDLPVARYRLSAAQPQVLHVPPGHATGWTNLEQNPVLMIFSSGKIENAKTDDFRFALGYWPIPA